MLSKLVKEVKMFMKRPVFKKILTRCQEAREFIQVLAGPRQVGKTTLAHQLEQELECPVLYVSADDAELSGSFWIEQQWETGRLKAKNTPNGKGSLLILDEIQKIPQWSESVKRLWDKDTASHIPLKVMLLGSSTLLIQQGLTESLAGRFELTPISHWSFAECREAFNLTLDQYIYFGGYPGAASLIQDQERWSQYILNSLIETSISKDIMLMVRIHKPALLKRVFELGCHYSGQILSYQKMLGQLQDAGNTVTLAHYLELLSGAGLLTGLQKFSHEAIREKASSPKFQVLNTALMSAQKALSFEAARQDGEVWGRRVESAIGAHLLNATRGGKIEVFYWREGNYEVDFVLRKGDDILPIEVKSTLKRAHLPGIGLFAKKFGSKRAFLVGGQGLAIEEFLLTNPEALF
jgi:predicted AAA+ superfamily ATPase